MLYCYSKKCFTGIIILMLMLAKTSYAAMRDTTLNPGSKTPDWVTGTVINKEGKTLKNVKISVKGNANFITTDDNGHFELSAPVGSVLVFKIPNYNVSETTIGENKNITVQLIDTYIQRPDNVDVLYGSQSSESVLGSISSMYTNQITPTTASSDLYALPGQLPGLYTLQTAGFPAFNITPNTTANGFALAGNTANEDTRFSNNTEFTLSLRGQTPVVIIDGIQRDIYSIDPESIASISVLKDALSSILLGINSSNGILLVTTKKAEVGKPSISFTADAGVQNSLGLPTPLPAGQWVYLYNEALTNDGQNPFYTSADFAAYNNGSDPYGHPNVNWFNTILRKNAPIQNYQLNVSGGNDVAKYTVGISYFDQEGIFNTDPSITYNTNNDLNRYNINSDVSVQVNKNLNVDLQLYGRVQRATEPGGGAQNILNLLYTTPNNAYPVYNPNGSFGGSSVGTSFENNLLSMTQNSGYIENNTDDIMANLSLNYNLGNITKGLTLKLNGNVSYESVIFLDRALQNTDYSYKDSSYTAVGLSSPEANSYNTVFTSRQSFGQAALNYTRQFGKSNITALALYDTKSVVENYDLPGVTIDRALKISYNYDGKYFAEGAINNSGYNRYPPGNQFGWFYAGGLGWQMGKEDFIKDNADWISSWKWRATYGKTGNANVDQYSYYGYEQTYEGGAGGQIYYTEGINHTESTYAMVPTPLSVNPYISWEQANKFDFGTDISLFKDHLQLTADYYHDRYYDLLEIRGDNTSLLGAPFPYENIGINLYHGFELSATYRDNAGKFNYFITGNISDEASKVVYNDEAIIYPLSEHTGLPVTAIFGYKSDGFYENEAQAAAAPTLNGYQPRPGDIKLEDISGPDGKPDGILNAFDQTAIGGLKPLVFYGGTLGFNYQGFSLSIVLQGVLNRQIDIADQMTEPFTGLNGYGGAPQGQAFTTALARWTPETAATAQLPEVSFENVALGGYNSQLSSFYIRSGDYIRLKNAEIGYTLPYSWSSKLKVSSIRVFANGENLFTIAGYGGTDPEFTYTGNNYPYPIQRVITAGVSVKL
jgi:TonB-linked SusC/RagA family outer membrane protein